MLNCNLPHIRTSAHCTHAMQTMWLARQSSLLNCVVRSTRVSVHYAHHCTRAVVRPQPAYETQTSEYSVHASATIELDCGLSDVSDTFSVMKWFEHSERADEHKLFGVVVISERTGHATARDNNYEDDADLASRITIHEKYRLTNLTDNLTVTCRVDDHIVHVFNIFVDTTGTHLKIIFIHLKPVFLQTRPHTSSDSSARTAHTKSHPATASNSSATGNRRRWSSGGRRVNWIPTHSRYPMTQTCWTFLHCIRT
jgi:hypothetical protein